MDLWPIFYLLKQLDLKPYSKCARVHSTSMHGTCRPRSLTEMAFYIFSVTDTQPRNNTHSSLSATPCLPWDPRKSLLWGLQCQKAGSHSCAHPPFSMCESECVCFFCVNLHFCVDLGQCVCVCVSHFIYLLCPSVNLASMMLISLPTSLVQKFCQTTETEKDGFIRADKHCVPKLCV